MHEGSAKRSTEEPKSNDDSRLDEQHADVRSRHSRPLRSSSSRSARRTDYENLAQSLRGLGDDATPDAVVRARQRFEAIRRIDFFEAPGRKRVEALLSRF